MIIIFYIEQSEIYLFGKLNNYSGFIKDIS